MRIIYINGTKSRIEDGCGLRPFKQCPLQVWALDKNYTVQRETSIFPLQTKINITSVSAPDDASLAIAKICDECFFGACHNIRCRTHRTK